MIATRALEQGGADTHPVMVSRLEHFFRRAGGLDIDKQDVKRYRDFLNRKLDDLMVRGVANAKANDRVAVATFDLPIGKGLQENINAFRVVDREVDIEPILDRLLARPQLDLPLDDASDGELPRVAGGLSLALVKAFKILDPELKNPDSEDWQRAGELFDLLI